MPLAARSPSLIKRVASGRTAVIGIPYGWLLAFFFLPFLILAKISISEMENVSFKDLISYQGGLLQLQIKLGNYVFITQDALYYKTYLPACSTRRPPPCCACLSATRSPTSWRVPRPPCSRCCCCW